MVKKITWTIIIYTDDERKNKVFQKDYSSVVEVCKEFTFSKSFLYDCIRRKKEGRFNFDNSKQKSKINKYKRLTVIKTSSKGVERFN